MMTKDGNRYQSEGAMRWPYITQMMVKVSIVLLCVAAVFFQYIYSPVWAAQPLVSARLKHRPVEHHFIVSKSIQRFGFDNQLTESSSGQQFLGKVCRTYNPIVHLFMSRDSLSPFDKGGLNGYLFANNNPIKNYDPSGHMAKPVKVFIEMAVWLSSTLLLAGLLISLGYGLSIGLERIGFVANKAEGLGVVGLIAAPILAGFIDQKLDDYLNTVGGQKKPKSKPGVRLHSMVKSTHNTLVGFQSVHPVAHRTF